MGDIKDWYQVLQVSEQATDEMIKAAYRKLVKKYHPDVHPGDQECEERFRAVSEAYRILSDPEKRRAYDEERKAAVKGRKSGKTSAGNQTSHAGPVDFQDAYKQFEKFFGFHPDTKEIVNEEKLNPESHNPLDTTDLFEKFMGIKR